MLALRCTPSTRGVADASVVAAAFFPEPHSQEAQALLVSGNHLCTPDLIYPELANVVWKRYTRGEIAADESSALLADMMALPLEITSSERVAGAALALAMQTGRTAYDCLYLALAVQSKAVMISNDRRLVNALRTGPLKDHAAWLGDAR